MSDKILTTAQIRENYVYDSERGGDGPVITDDQF